LIFCYIGGIYDRRDRQLYQEGLGIDEPFTCRRN
jgi:hypothetical protein